MVAGYFIYSMSQNIVVLTSSTETLRQRITNLEAGFATTTLTSNELSQQLSNQSESLQTTINNITGTVNTLERLSQTDKELLQKYSKVYFLSENYVPMSLATIDEKYVYDKTKALLFHTKALPYLERMLDEASSTSISIKIVSAYRTFHAQSTLKNDYTITYGSGANQFSAEQGYSEHQLGTAVDLAFDGSKTLLDVSFANTEAYAWLVKNAHRYGFILSYPKNNIYYQYEPWHWRFVGVGLAYKLYNSGKNFSDLDQREIDTYLANIFD
jgi:D-alanyl-D-alanine carboxypeptidase